MNGKRNILMGIIAVICIGAIMVRPANAWSDIGVEYYDNVIKTYGAWDETYNEATEDWQDGNYRHLVTFEIYNIDQTANTYKVRIDYDGFISEWLAIYYRWGTSGTFIKITDIVNDNPFDIKFTIADATSTTLQVQFLDWHWLFDWYYDEWYFGREPECWMYWN